MFPVILFADRVAVSNTEASDAERMKKAKPETREEANKSEDRRQPPLEARKDSKGSFVTTTRSAWSHRPHPTTFRDRTSSSSLDMSDGIIQFRDADGSYTSECDHYALDTDHMCRCKAHSMAQAQAIRKH